MLYQQMKSELDKQALLFLTNVIKLVAEAEAQLKKEVTKTIDSYSGVSKRDKGLFFFFSKQLIWIR